jgi:peroxiredoxin
MDAAGSRSPGRFRTWRQWLAILSAFLWLCTLAAQSTAGDSAGSATLIAADDTSRPLFVLPSLDGPKQELARLRGRVVLVHFFATWCEPCRAEIERLSQMHSRFEHQPFAIVSISVAEADGAVRRFFAGDTLPFAILLDRDRSIARSWNIDALPSTVVLDRSLKPRFIAQGDVDWMRPDVMNTVADLLMETPG